jgi:hypothetical protein
MARAAYALKNAGWLAGPLRRQLPGSCQKRRGHASAAPAKPPGTVCPVALAPAPASAGAGVFPFRVREKGRPAWLMPGRAALYAELGNDHYVIFTEEARTTERSIECRLSGHVHECADHALMVRSRMSAARRHDRPMAHRQPRRRRRAGTCPRRLDRRGQQLSKATGCDGKEDRTARGAAEEDRRFLMRKRGAIRLRPTGASAGRTGISSSCAACPTEGGRRDDIGPELLADPAVIAHMGEEDFGLYWAAPVTVTRLSARHAAAVAAER